MALRTLDDHLIENSSDEDFDDDLALLTRKFKKFIKRNKFKSDEKKNLNPKRTKLFATSAKSRDTTKVIILKTRREYQRRRRSKQHGITRARPKKRSPTPSKLLIMP